MGLAIHFDAARIAEFCRRWKISELSLFGSILRDDLRPDSDVDVLVTFEPDIPWSLYDWMDMREELQDIFGREVDLVEKSGLRNPFRRHEILTHRKVILACSPKTGAWEMLESPERKEIRDEEEAVFGRANYQDFTASRAG